MKKQKNLMVNVLPNDKEVGTDNVVGINNVAGTDKVVGTDNEFTIKLDELKEKIVKLRDVNQNNFGLQKQTRDLAKKFIEEFRGTHKVELGKSVSWLGDVLSPDELISVIGDSISKLDRTILHVKVRDRLEHGYSKPECYMNNRITDLVNQLNVYDSYIDTFDFIEIRGGDNCLDQNKYLISHALHNLLINGYRINRDRSIQKGSDGLYLVVFGTITVKGENVLVYNYIKYDYIFYDTLYNYIKIESSSTVVTNDRTVGADYLFIMRYFFENLNEMVNEIKHISDLFDHKFKYSTSIGIYPRNLIDLCKGLLKGCPVFLNNEDISKFIKLAWEKNSYEAIVGLVKLYDFYKNDEEGLNMLQDKLKKTNLNNFNFLGRLVFITDDLQSLVKDIKNSVDSKVNEGPQAWRGQSNYLNHTISRIDSDFRESLNRHNQYHVNVGNIPKNSLIGRSKFLYQNIHKNLGNVRFYSQKLHLQPVRQ